MSRLKTSANMGKDQKERRMWEIALHALQEVADFKFHPQRPVADHVRVKMKAQKALDDIRKLDTNTNTNGKEESDRPMEAGQERLHVPG